MNANERPAMTESKVDDLLPCPFCGMAAEIVTRPVSYGREFWYVYHPEHPSGDCILEDQKFSSARGWNTRAAVAELIEAAEAFAPKVPLTKREQRLVAALAACTPAKSEGR